MKRQWFAYFAIALLAELGTTWSQSRFHVVTDLEDGVIFYPALGTFLLVRLVIWLFLYFVLTGAWILLRKFVHQTKPQRVN